MLLHVKQVSDRVVLPVDIFDQTYNNNAKVPMYDQQATVQWLPSSLSQYSIQRADNFYLVLNTKHRIMGMSLLVFQVITVQFTQSVCSEWDMNNQEFHGSPSDKDISLKAINVNARVCARGKVRGSRTLQSFKQMLRYITGKVKPLTCRIALNDK